MSRFLRTTGPFAANAGSVLGLAGVVGRLTGLDLSGRRIAGRSKRPFRVVDAGVGWAEMGTLAELPGRELGIFRTGALEGERTAGLGPPLSHRGALTARPLDGSSSSPLSFRFPPWPGFWKSVTTRSTRGIRWGYLTEAWRGRLALETEFHRQGVIVHP